MTDSTGKELQPEDTVTLEARVVSGDEFDIEVELATNGQRILTISEFVTKKAEPEPA